MERRTFLGTVGTGAVGLLAGCGAASDETSTTETTTAERTTTRTTTATDASYTVSMAPMGDVAFDSVPETWVANNGSYADMGLALGLDAPKALWLANRWHTNYYDEIDGVSADESDTLSLYRDGVSKERYYAIDADVHVQDPNFLTGRFGWDDADVEEIRENVAPFFGNSVFSRTYSWHEGYRYYSLYEAFEKVAQLFERIERYEAFASLHEEFRSNLDFVPSADAERPRVAVLWPASDTSFYPYLVGEGTSFKQWRDLNVRDALAETDVQDFHSGRGEVDYETLLDVDPDVLLLRGHESKTRAEFEESVVAPMEENETASELTAVRNGDVYRGGPLYQGPISNLVLTERAASQLYDHDDRLFERERVAAIVEGDL